MVANSEVNILPPYVLTSSRSCRIIYKALYLDHSNVDTPMLCPIEVNSISVNYMVTNRSYGKQRCFPCYIYLLILGSFAINDINMYIFVMFKIKHGICLQSSVNI